MDEVATRGNQEREETAARLIAEIGSMEAQKRPAKKEWQHIATAYVARMKSFRDRQNPTRDQWQIAS